MRVVFRQMGGYAGLSRGCELDAQDLGPDERAFLSASWPRGQQSAKTRARDLETYELRIENGGRSQTLIFDQLSVPAGAEPLLDRLKRESGPRPPA